MKQRHEFSPGMRRSAGAGQRGFTVVELLVVITIAVMLLGIVGVRFAAGTPGVELRGATRDISSGLRHVRSLAMVTGQEQVFMMDIDQKTYWIGGRDGQLRSLPERVELHLFTARQEVIDDNIGGIRFFPDGSATGGRVTISIEGSEYEVDVDWITGRVKILE